MSAPATVCSSAQSDEARLQAADGEGEMETCVSTDFSWYADAERDKQRYLRSLEKDLALVEEQEREKTAIGLVEETSDFTDLYQNRSASYSGWEDEELGEWAPETILKRSNRKGVRHYLVKWWHHDTPTWESAEDLEEEGHFILMAKFDAERASAKARPATKVTRTEKKEPPEPIPRILPTWFDPTTFWPDYAERIIAAFNACEYTNITEIHNVLTEDVAAAFMAHWQGDTNFVPAMLFHGTRLESIVNITEKGFIVPGQGGVRVVNGSVHGVGIYTATCPSVSLSYAQGGYMFVCAGLVGSSYWSTTKNLGNVCVFFESDRVVPCFLVKFDHRPEFAESEYFPSFDAEAFKTKIAAEAPPSPPPVRPPPPPPPVIGPAEPRTLRSGGQEPGMSFSKNCRTLTKKQLRAAPRAAKDAYKAGLLLQYKC